MLLAYFGTFGFMTVVFGSSITMCLHFHCTALNRLSNNVCVALLHIAGHSFIAAHIIIACAALSLVRVGALSLVLGLSNCEVAHLTTFPAFLTAAFLPLVLVVSTLGHRDKETKEHLEQKFRIIAQNLLLILTPKEMTFIVSVSSHTDCTPLLKHHPIYTN